MSSTTEIATIRAALDACNQGNTYEKHLAREDLGQRAEAYIEQLLNEIDALIAMIRDLDEHTTRDDPSHDTELEAAHHKITSLNRALQNEISARTLVLQRVARSVRRAYEEGYEAGRQHTND